MHLSLSILQHRFRLLKWYCLWLILGGNQREQDRLKAQKKAAANAKKPKESATNLAKRKEACVYPFLTPGNEGDIYVPLQ